jgi:hypothetical protein
MKSEEDELQRYSRPSGTAEPEASPSLRGNTEADNRQWALDNIYTIAIREERYGGERARAWAHVRRLCERFDCAVRAVRPAEGK